MYAYIMNFSKDMKVNLWYRLHRFILTNKKGMRIMSKSKVMNYEGAVLENAFIIDCEDIILREFRLEDLDELYALTLQSEITDYLSDWKSTKEQRKEWLRDFHIKSNKEFLEAVPNIQDQLLFLGIILKKTNEFIGWCCTGLKDELPLPNREIAYAISKDYRGKGYTTQAAQGLIKYLFEYTNIELLNAITLTYNIPSNRVIQKCGFNYIKSIDIENEEFYHYKLSKKEWKNKEYQ